MTVSELSQRINVVSTTSYGHFRVTIEYRNKKYSCITNNAPAVDRHDDDDAKGPHFKGIYTQKDALETLWSECKRKNNLR
jgi:hypothetical protein